MECNPPTLRTLVTQPVSCVIYELSRKMGESCVCLFHLFINFKCCISLRAKQYLGKHYDIPD